MRPKREVKAVSVLIWIILMLCSLIIGGLISYLWVMGNFYLEPNAIQLAITDVRFPVDHADYFNLTVMNPSSSISGTNITEISVTVAGNDTLIKITKTWPEDLPMIINKADVRYIKCIWNWGEFAGKSITVHVMSLDAEGVVKTVQTPFVRLNLNVFFDPSVSSKQFNLTVQNDQTSAIGLTLSKVSVNQKTVDDLRTINGTPINLPAKLNTADTMFIQCTFDWETLANPVVRVETDEGYFAEKTANATARVSWFVTQAMFNETNPQEFNVTVFNAPPSSTYIDIQAITLTYVNGTRFYVNGSLTSPQFTPSLDTPYYRLGPNETVTFSHCIWNWRSYPDDNVTVNVYNLQSYETVSRMMTIPPPTIFEIGTVDFNLTNTGYFGVNVTNMRASSQDVVIDKIMLNDQVASFANQTIPIGEERQFNCTLDWSALRGQTIAITVNTTTGQQHSISATLPSVDLKISDTAAFNSTTDAIPYVNITVFNTAFSARNVTITGLTFAIGNSTFTIDGTLTNPQIAPNGTLLVVNSNITIVSLWNWNTHHGETLTVTVQTADGFTSSQTFQIP